MLQRIQTIYLLLGAGFLSGAASLPIMNSSAPVTASTLFADGIFQASDKSWLLVLFFLVGLLLLVAVFLFRNRKTQALLVKMGMVLTLVSLAAAAYLLNAERSLLPEQGMLHIGVGAFLPLAGIIVQALALRHIQKDDKLVRSMDRLR